MYIGANSAMDHVKMDYGEIGEEGAWGKKLFVSWRSEQSIAFQREAEQIVCVHGVRSLQ